MPSLVTTNKLRRTKFSYFKQEPPYFELINLTKTEIKQDSEKFARKESGEAKKAFFPIFSWLVSSNWLKLLMNKR